MKHRPVNKPTGEVDNNDPYDADDEAEVAPTPNTPATSETLLETEIGPYTCSDLAQLASGSIIIICLMVGVALNWSSSDHHFGQ